MKKKRKNKIIILIIIFALIIGSSGIFIYNFIKESIIYSNVIKSNWNIELSSKYKEIYSADTGQSFLGNGNRYHILEYINNKDIENALEWQEYKSEKTEDFLIEELNSLNVPKEYLPDFNSYYKYYSKSKGSYNNISIRYFVESNRLYIYEQFM